MDRLHLDGSVLSTAAQASRQASSGSGRRRATYVSLRQESRTELHVVVEVKGAASLELLAKGRERGGVGKFLHAAHTPELLVGVLRGRQARGATRATGMVLSSRVRVSVVVIEGRHYWIMKKREVVVVRGCGCILGDVVAVCLGGGGECRRIARGGAGVRGLSLLRDIADFL